MLQWDLPAHQTRQPGCSVNHTSTIWKRKWGIQPLHLVQGCVFGTYCFFSLHPPLLKKSSSRINLHAILAPLEPLFFSPSPAFFVLQKCLLQSKLQALRNSPSANSETRHKLPNLWTPFITLILKVLLAEAMFCFEGGVLASRTSLAHQPQEQKPRQWLYFLGKHVEKVPPSREKHHNLGRGGENKLSRNLTTEPVATFVYDKRAVIRSLPAIITTRHVRLSSPTTGSQFSLPQWSSHSWAPSEAPFMPFHAPLSLHRVVGD